MFAFVGSKLIEIPMAALIPGEIGMLVNDSERAATAGGFICGVVHR